MYHIAEELKLLYRTHNIRTTPAYDDIMAQALGPHLAYATSAMDGLCRTLFSSSPMIAYNLLQNSIDEAKGAARICVIADRYAPPELAEKMKRHVREELKHSAQFMSLISTIEVGQIEREESPKTPAEVSKVLDFDDELRSFICRVHSIEIRSWRILVTYMDVLRERGEPALLKALPVIEEIMGDEINHVLYTGEQINRWIEQDPALCATLRECLAHTNRETWHDMATMSNYLADNSFEALAA